MGAYSRLGKNTALVIIGSAGSKLITLLMLPLYTRWLTTSDYGGVDLITTYSALLLGIVSCSIYDSIFIFPKDKPLREQKEYLSTGLSFGLVTIAFSGILCLCLKALAERYQWRGFFIDYLWSIYGLLAINYLQTILQQFLRAIDKMLVYSVTGIVMTVSLVGFAFIFIPNGGIHGYVLSIIFAGAVSALYSIIFGSIYNYFSFSSIRRSVLKEMLYYSIPLIPNGIMWFLISSLNRPLIENWIGLASVGIFAVASKFPNLLNTVYLLFQNAWLISVLEEAKKETYEVFYNRMLKLVVFGQTILAVVLAIASRWIIRLFTTPDYYSAWQYIPLLVISVIYMNVATFVGSNFAVTRESKYYFYSSVWAGLASILLNLALIPYIGLWGACFSMIISQFIGLIFRIKYSWKTVQISTPTFYLIVNVFLYVTAGICILIPLGFIYCLSMITILGLFLFVNRKYFLNIYKLSIEYYVSHKHSAKN